MPYTGTPEQRKLLQAAMQELHTKRGATDGEVVTAIERWVDSDPKGGWPSISVRNYNRYRLSGIKNYALGSLIYNFLSRGPDRYRVISSALSGKRAFTEDQKFVDELLTRFPASDSGYGYERIQSMAYTYELYRRSWRVLDGKHFVRSLLRVEQEAGVYRLTEVQKFDAHGITIDETDAGWVLPYSTNFVAMTNSRNCMKFYVFHDLFPTPGEEKAITEMRGNLIAVAGKGPHPSFRILARRIKTGAVDMGHYHIDEFANDEGMRSILAYVMENS